jgi:Na+-transporting NADH:ubiquinone oxidoreductase subunit C
MAEEMKKKLNTNSNSYTIVYAMVIVLVVAFMLAFVFQALKPAQDANVALDKKKQILYALNIRNLSDEAAAEKYSEVVLSDDILDEQGSIINKGESGAEKVGFKELNSSAYKAGRLVVFVCSVDGETKYVLPVYGMGLWGPINGYIALNADKATVYGAYFNHEGETAGLGAEIKDNQQWQEKFQGKKLFADDSTKIALGVEKKVSNPESQVDAVTGATLTSNGVRDMLQECLAKYMKFLHTQN